MLDRVGIEVTRFWDVAMLGEAKTRALQPFLQRIPKDVESIPPTWLNIGHDIDRYWCCYTQIVV
jgi:hypothetical protein